MISYLRSSIKRKLARRFTKEYPTTISNFPLETVGLVQFANWQNPLIKPFKLTDKMVAFFSRYIRKGDFVIDIGANIGDTTVPMALAAGIQGMAVGFDPNPYVYKVLKANSALNFGKMNIHPYPFAITPTQEEFYYISSEASFSNGGLSKTRNSKHGRFVFPEMIQGINLYDFLEKNYSQHMSRLSFIKIDTEGLDKEIIKSIADVIQRCKPVIVAECFSKSSDEEKMELYEVVENLGYEISRFEDFDNSEKPIRLNNKRDLVRVNENIHILCTPLSGAKIIGMPLRKLSSLL